MSEQSNANLSNIPSLVASQNESRRSSKRVAAAAASAKDAKESERFSDRANNNANKRLRSDRLDKKEKSTPIDFAKLEMVIIQISLAMKTNPHMFQPSLTYLSMI
jgi:hypothetical protein